MPGLIISRIGRIKNGLRSGSARCDVPGGEVDLFPLSMNGSDGLSTDEA